MNQTTTLTAETTMLNEINARIASEMKMDANNLPDSLVLKIKRVASSRKYLSVKVTQSEYAALEASDLWQNGWFMYGGAQMVSNGQNLWKL